MLTTLLRVLVVALAIAVPLQGMAAVTAGQCMAFGHHEQDAGHGQHGPGEHSPEDEDGHSHAQDDQNGSDAHCGPCVACCASAAIAGPLAVPALSSHANTKYILFQAAPPGIAPQRLDRPPLAL